MPTATISPEAVLRDLQRQWADLAHEDSGGVLRACAMTLVVVARNAAESLDARQTAGMVMRVHPSRAIIVHPGPGEFSANVFAECWKPLGKNQQICSEGIEITSGPGGFAEVARFLVPLRVPDLPVVLWCRDATPSDAEAYHALYALADKVIFDTKKAPDADAALRSLHRLHAVGLRVADLHWTRLSGWREVVAHLFDQGVEASQVRSARITYGGGPITTCARYFEWWIHAALPLARVSIEPDYGPPGLYSVTLSTSRGNLIITREEDQMLTIVGRGLNYRTPLPAATEAVCMQEELSILGSDPVFERLLDV